MRKRLGVLIAGIAALSCISPLAPQSCGSFVGRAGGAATDSLSGCAFFTVDQVTGTFGMVLTNGGPSNTTPAVKLFRPQGRPPAAGTYTLGCGSGELLCGPALLGPRVFTLTGTVVVTQTDSLGIKGSIDAVGLDSLGASLDIRGDFVAACKGQKSPFETQGDRNDNTERFTPCRPSAGRG